MHRFCSRLLRPLAACTLWAACSTAWAYEFGYFCCVPRAQVPGQGTAQTTLLHRDLNGDSAAGAFYDTALNITGLTRQDLQLRSLQPRSLHGGNGGAPWYTWAEARRWADGLVVPLNSRPRRRP